MFDGKRIYPSYASWAVFEVAKGKLALPPIPAQETKIERDEAAYWAARDVVTIR